VALPAKSSAVSTSAGKSQAIHPPRALAETRALARSR
jgi:hypothetical protein